MIIGEILVGLGIWYVVAFIVEHVILNRPHPPGIDEKFW